MARRVLVSGASLLAMTTAPLAIVCAQNLDLSPVLTLADAVVSSTSDTNNPGRPGLGYDGTNYLMVSCRDNDTVTEIFGVLLTPNGLILTSFPIADVNTVYGCSGRTASVAFDGTNYFVVASLVNEQGYNDLVGFKITPSGRVLNGPDGVTVMTQVGMHDIAFDGTNFLVIGARYANDTLHDIVGARVSTAGVVLGEIVISEAPGSQIFPAVAFDGDNYFAVWSDNRSGVPDIYGARITTAGAVLDADGIEISVAPGEQTTPAITFDGQNLFAVWEDRRSDPGSVEFPPPLDIYGARITPGGTVIDGTSGAGGIAINTTAGLQSYPTVATDGNEYIVAWEEAWSYDPPLGIFATRVSTAGQLLEDPANQLGVLIGAPDCYTCRYVRPASLFAGGRLLLSWILNSETSATTKDVLGRLSGNLGAISTAAYFPLQSGDQWQYDVDDDPGNISTTTVLPGTLMVNGAVTTGLQTVDIEGTATNYFTNDAAGIRLHRQLADGDTITFNPPIRMAYATATLGESIPNSGTAQLIVSQVGTFSLAYSATARIQGSALRTVPAGVFPTVGIELTLELSGNVNGFPFSSSEVDTFWLAPYLGTVRSMVDFEGAISTDKLVSTSVDYDSDGHLSTVDNCPGDWNPGQTNTDGDWLGDACDPDDDDDGVPDVSDDFPLDPTETTDTDLDGIGDNMDPDDDNDGLPDVDDEYPLGRFDDAGPRYWSFLYIELLARSGITAGCGGDNYCPEDAVTRAQMAVFLERGIHGAGFMPMPATGGVFLDVGSGDFAAAFIEQLFVDGITGGCGGGNFCPNDAVTRAQMAVFLLRAIHGSAYKPPLATGTRFNDVGAQHWAAAWIEQLAAEGVTAGCGGGAFCPENPVTRAQMAVFLVRAFGL